ncbi:hypothetical protein FN846DRAFT_523548 [Sphaerosporella brunnea]|uniref:Uncharacterized protein n=1 Tax=Sphaerosporella brunnea TaxID=1250544 RepID=A0A5J5EE33_9PEZI|nr:hypothetical protein FN846DRAFT_523548 [Sphaerosporella brunnea]
MEILGWLGAIWLQFLDIYLMSVIESAVMYGSFTAYHPPCILVMQPVLKHSRTVRLHRRWSRFVKYRVPLRDPQTDIMIGMLQRRGRAVSEDGFEKAASTIPGSKYTVAGTSINRANGETQPVLCLVGEASGRWCTTRRIFKSWDTRETLTHDRKTEKNRYLHWLGSKNCNCWLKINAKESSSVLAVRCPAFIFSL